MANAPVRGGVRLVSDDEAEVVDAQLVDDADLDPDDLPAETETQRKRRDEALVGLAKRQFELVCRVEDKQRKRELEDLKFDRALLEDHWPDDILKPRLQSSPNAPARPCLVIPKTDLPVQQILNEAKRAKLSIRVKAKPGSGATKDAATLRQKAYRAIEQDSNAAVARYWALDRAAKCGRGYWRVLTTYANDLDFDLDIRITRIPNQASVYLDPYHKEPSGCDAGWAFITDDLDPREYRRTYKHSTLAKMLELPEGERDWTSINDIGTGWVSDESVRVAEWFRVVNQRKERLFVPDRLNPTLYQPRWADEFDDPEELEYVRKQNGVRSRVIETPRIEWYLINGHEILDRAIWPGRYIPIVQVLGKEYNVNGDRTYKGVVSNAKDSQRQYNYMRSALVEVMALSSKAPWIMAEGQDEGFEQLWDEANVRNFSRLLYKPTVFEGHLVPPPQRNVADAPIQSYVIAIQMADEDIKATTGRHDASLGKFRSDESGVAVRERKMQGEQSSSNYLDNLATVAMPHEGAIVLDLMPHVYDRPGRIIRLLGENQREGEELAMIDMPFVTGDDGEPVPMPPPPGGMAAAPAPPMPPMPPMMGPAGAPPPAVAPPMPPSAPPKVKNYTFKDGGNYAFVVGVGPSVQVEKEANAAVLETLMQTVPDAAPHIADIFAEQLEGDIADRLATRLKKLSPVAAEADAEDQELPPVAQAKIFALQQQLQQTTQQMQQLAQELATKKYAVDANNETKIQLAEMNAALQKALTMMKSDVQLDVTDIKADTDLTKQARDHAQERLMFERQAGEAVSADERKEGMAAAADERKGRLAAAADTRRGSQAVAADRRQGAMAADADARRGTLARHADDRKGRQAEAADVRKARLAPKAPPAKKR